MLKKHLNSPTPHACRSLQPSIEVLQTRLQLLNPRLAGQILHRCFAAYDLPWLMLLVAQSHGRSRTI